MKIQFYLNMSNNICKCNCDICATIYIICVVLKHFMRLSKEAAYYSTEKFFKAANDKRIGNSTKKCLLLLCVTV